MMLKSFHDMNTVFGIYNYNRWADILVSMPFVPMIPFQTFRPPVLVISDFRR